MGIISKKTQFGWYGTCDTIRTCQPLSLDGNLSSTDTGEDRSKMSAIIRVSDLPGHEGDVFEKFTPYNKNKSGLANLISNSGKTFDYFFNNNFQQLDCGRGYIVVGRGTFTDFNIQDFNIADETGFVSSACADIDFCTQEGNLVYNISLQSKIFDSTNGVISSGIKYTGKLSVPKPQSSTSSTPYAVDLLHNGELIGHITFTGSSLSSSNIYLSVTEGEFKNKCFSGEISNNVCELKE